MPDPSALSLYERIEKKDKRALEQLNGLNQYMKTARRFDARVTTLQVFEDNTDDRGQRVPMSKREWRDHPDVQVLLMRRDRYRQLQSDEAAARKILEMGLDGKSQAQLYETIATLGKQMQVELDAIQKALLLVRQCSTEHWRMVARMLCEMRKIFMADAHHHDRMKRAGDPLDDITDADLAAE